MWKRLLISQTRDIIIKKINNTTEFIIPLIDERLKDHLVYTVKIEHGELKILFINRDELR